MAAFGTGGFRSQGRGASPGPRFFVYAVLSVVIMFLDQRLGWMEHVRSLLSTLAYPVQLAVNSPSSVWRWLQENFESRDALRVENEHLKAQDRALSLRVIRYDELERENAALRGLRDGLPPLVDHWIAAEVMNVEVDSLRQRVIINKGSVNGIFKGQTVLDEKGVIGQTTHVALLSSEVILITDPEHAIPVQVERTGLRTIAVGAGDMASLALPYLPGNADLKPGDVLVSSGLGGVFPAGYPVAKVAEVHRDAVQPLAQVRAVPFADIETDREVELVWFREDNPAAPTPPTTATGDLHGGNPKLQPQPAPPPRPKPAAPEAAPGSAATQAPAPAPTSPQKTPAAPARAPSNPGDKTPVATPKKPTQPETAAPSPDATPRTP